MAPKKDDDEPITRIFLDGPPGPPGPRVPRRLNRAMEDLQDLGLSPSFLERFVGWWKRYGIRKAAIFAFAVLLPVIRYVWLPSSISTGLSTYAEAYGADLQVEDWTTNWSDIAVTGENVTLFARGPYAEQRLLQADEIELNWSLWRGVGNAWGRVRSIFWGETPPEEPVHVMRLKEATLHVERLLSGRWNWQDAVDLSSVNSEHAPILRLPAFDAEALRLVWVENLPGESGGGLIEQRSASLYLDDVRMRFNNLVLPDDRRTNGTRFTMEGRSGDGRFSVSGDVNLARWAQLAPGQGGGIRRVAFTDASGMWMPTFSLSMYLENFGAAAFGRLVSDASLLPSAGTMSGKINLAVAEDGNITCELDLQLINIRYAANPRSSYIKAKREEVEAGIKDLVINERITRRCQAEWQEPDLRVAKALQAEITAEAVKNATMMVQAAAGYDRLRFVEADQEAIKSFTSGLATRIGAAVGGDAGAIIAVALAEDTAAPSRGEENPIKRGLSSVGRGFKRVFGGKKND